MVGLAHRAEGYALLSGNGLEIGALHQPASLPSSCTIEYADVATPEEIQAVFPELDPSTLIGVHHRVNLDHGELDRFPPGSYDFVIMNHVIEHLANPIASLRQLFRVVRPGGYLVISAPDKAYTFDKPRSLTPFSHLAGEYRTGVREVTDDHYLDFLRHVHPEVFEDGAARLEGVLANVRARHEHAHVWTSESFRAFLDQAFALLGVRAELCFEVDGGKTQSEYFSVWRKRPETRVRVWAEGLSRLWRRIAR